MISARFCILSMLLTLTFTVTIATSFSQSGQEHRKFEISGQCLQCLVRVRNDFKGKHNNASNDQLTFAVDEGVKDLTIDVSSSREYGGTKYVCDMQSGAILDRKDEK